VLVPELGFPYTHGYPIHVFFLFFRLEDQNKAVGAVVSFAISLLLKSLNKKQKK
jgi:hypothetical protein